MAEEVLTEKQLVTLATQYLKGSGNATFKDLEKFFEFCREATITYALVQMILKGQVIVTRDEETDRYLFRTDPKAVRNWAPDDLGTEPPPFE